MKVKELREALAAYPDDMEVDVRTHWDGWQTIDKVEKGAKSVFSESERRWVKHEILALGRIGKGNYEID